MSQRNPALVMSRSVRFLEIFFDWYCRLNWIERSGRIYELLGLRTLYIGIAHLFQETVVPPSRRLRGDASLLIPDLTSDVVRELRDRTLYYEISNLFIFLCYAPLVVTLSAMQTRLAIYAAILCSLHVLLVCIERYKRALYGICLEQLDFSASLRRSNPVLSRQPVAATPAPPEKRRIATWYFTPHRFETEPFYAALGMKWVRNQVITFTRLTTLPPEQRHQNPHCITGSAVENLVAFDHETRISEVSHLIGALLQLPFLALFLYRRVPVGVAYILLLLYFNMSFVLLQRATRVRLWRVLAKRRVSRQ